MKEKTLIKKFEKAFNKNNQNNLIKIGVGNK